jgi:hypothetical protein
MMEVGTLQEVPATCKVCQGLLMVFLCPGANAELNCSIIMQPFQNELQIFRPSAALLK